MSTEKPSSYTYWKRPWQKWLVLIAGLLQVATLWLLVQEYRDVAAAGILSSTAWESYAVQQSFTCAINGMTATVFLGIFLIGTFARSRKMARMAEGTFLLVLALVWGVVGFVLRLTTQGGIRISWALLLVAALVGSVFTFWKSHNG